MRLSAKAFVVDADDRLLLLDCVDPARPHLRWWELPGGGLEDGEDEVDALVREVLEETGLSLDPAAVGPLAWTQEPTFRFRGRRWWTRCHGRVARVAGVPALAPVALTPLEDGSILGRRWWTPEELAGSDALFFPRSVPALLPRVLAGERVDEPFDHWD